ncbi:Uncharacterized protein Rs2_00754 [Raphanus sativus]|uniref:Uncharacterized protein LOC108844053 n=1 Tax=Raphanus sativus TaxID=3726 RepID=A0A6J0MJT4_RAPSA|nr:uncharacterized protein LOC108844053 [Raphanus sativus]XP_056852619.1 uncharacterized protein LOC130501816 [Raphanus sativus]KAJ4872609.1 Uncharacterized protein Rs2_45720 [Raphanus sativus]KAJ4915204.1 Uncharacterized protein Rs2_00754 [Raphanus sativus]
MSGSILEKATSALGEVAKTDVLKDAVDNVVSRGIDGAKSLLHNLEENKGQVSSKIVGAVSQFAGGSADSSATTTADRDLPMSTDNQPLLGAGETATPWWKSCCEILELLKASSSSN